MSLRVIFGRPSACLTSAECNSEKDQPFSNLYAKSDAIFMKVKQGTVSDAGEQKGQEKLLVLVQADFISLLLYCYTNSPCTCCVFITVDTKRYSCRTESTPQMSRTSTNDGIDCGRIKCSYHGGCQKLSTRFVMWDENKSHQARPVLVGV